LTNVDTTRPSYMQEGVVPMESETHGGEDVPIYAGGPHAYLFRGALEQHVVFHVIAEAYDWNQTAR
ncbi:MAG TPA: alkaline phosphatase, partial [Steroidobacteraceae bacterium]|nr:alkaline phosphatase [Steroidobacteraceae bacterium]